MHKFKFGDRVRVTNTSKLLGCLYFGRKGIVIKEEFYYQGEAISTIRFDGGRFGLLMPTSILEVIEPSRRGHLTNFWARVNEMLRTKRERDE